MNCRLVFVFLAEYNNDERLLFVNVDLSNRSQLDQTRLLAETLGLSDLVENYQHTGQIFLVKSDGSIVDVLEGASERSLLVERISSHLKTNTEMN